MLVLFRLPFFISTAWDAVPELNWMLVGEKMNEGAMLYVGIWDDIAPLSGWMFSFIDYLFGRSTLALQILGLLVYFFQIFYINYMALRHKMFNENNYLPALFYGILGIIFFNVTVLSPQMMGLTFVLLSLNSLFNHVEARERSDGNMLNIGLYIGISGLFYLPYLLLVFMHFAGLLLFTNTKRRRYLLLLYGAFIPLIICVLIYIWFGNTHALMHNFVGSIFKIQDSYLLSYQSLAWLLGPSVFLFIIAVFKVLAGFGFTVFQVRVQKTMFFAALVMTGIYILYSRHSGHGIIAFFPWMSFFMSHFFISIKNRLKRELGFMLYLLSVFLIFFTILNKQNFIANNVDLDKLLVYPSTHKPVYTGKKILVLGDDIRPYYYAYPATPYLNWSLSKDQLLALDYYDNLESIDKNFRLDMPDYIIDQINLAPRLLAKFPLIEKEYQPVEDHIYKRKSSN